ncbi:TPA: hypothetical protein ACL6CV_001965, partial [Streptococcus pneumoniae]
KIFLFLTNFRGLCFFTPILRVNNAEIKKLRALKIYAVVNPKVCQIKIANVGEIIEEHSLNILKFERWRSI